MHASQDAARLNTEIGRDIRILARRVTFAVALAAALIVSRPGVSFWTFPAVTRPWALIPFAVLFLVSVIDAEELWSMRNLELLALVVPVLALATWTHSGVWQFALLYLPLVFLMVRMTVRAGLWSRRGVSASRGSAFSAQLPVSWLSGGVLGLVVVHVLWTLDSGLSTDIGLAVRPEEVVQLV